MKIRIDSFITPLCLIWGQDIQDNCQSRRIISPLVRFIPKSSTAPNKTLKRRLNKKS